MRKISDTLPMNFKTFLENADKIAQLKKKQSEHGDAFKKSVQKDRDHQATQIKNQQKRNLQKKIDKAGVSDDDGLLNPD